MREYNKQWRKENKEYLALYNRKRMAHKKHQITNEELQKLYEYCNSSCMYCGMSEEESKGKFGERLHKDHAINDGSNKIDNCVMACKSCNVSKRSNDWFDWYTPENEHYSEERYIKIENWLNQFKN